MRPGKFRGDAVVFGSIQRTITSKRRWVSQPSNSRVQFAALVVLFAIVTELWTRLPGLRLLLAVIVIYAPAFLFIRFWRFLIWLRGGDNLDKLLARRYRHDWRGWKRLWLAFGTVWLLDLVATVWFFFVPGVSELHPVTVFLYQIAGVLGVMFAGASYAGFVVVITRTLPAPVDFDFLVAAMLWYGILVVYNYVLLLG